MRLITLSVGVALLAAAAMAQAPLLQVSPAQMGRHGWEVTITNRYTQPATAFAIQIGAVTADQHRVRGLHWEDAIPGNHPERIVLQPGASRSIHLGSPQWPAPEYTSVAVVYADGATAGDPAVLRHILKVRQAELADLPQAIAILDGANGDAAAVRASLLATFEQRETAGKAAVNDGVIAPMDRVCGSVVGTMQNDTNEDPLLQAAALRQEFQRWQQQLASSLPKAQP